MRFPGRMWQRCSTDRPDLDAGTALNRSSGPWPPVAEIKHQVYETGGHRFESCLARSSPSRKIAWPSHFRGVSLNVIGFDAQSILAHRRRRTIRNGPEAQGAPKGTLTDLADLLDQIGHAADLSPRPGLEREGVSEGRRAHGSPQRRGAGPSLAARGAGHRSTLLRMVESASLRTACLRSGGGGMRRRGPPRGRDVSRRLGTGEHVGWLREVVAGRVELVRRDPTREFARMDGPS
jgi:hypothetical protein